MVWWQNQSIFASIWKTSLCYQRCSQPRMHSCDRHCWLSKNYFRRSWRIDSSVENHKTNSGYGSFLERTSWKSLVYPNKQRQYSSCECQWRWINHYLGYQDLLKDYLFVWVYSLQTGSFQPRRISNLDNRNRPQGDLLGKVRWPDHQIDWGIAKGAEHNWHNSGRKTFRDRWARRSVEDLELWRRCMLLWRWRTLRFNNKVKDISRW